MKKDKIYYKVNYKSTIFLKDKGNIIVYEIISENKRINGIEIYQLEANKKYFLRNSIYKTTYYDSIQDLLQGTKLTHPEYNNRNKFQHFSGEISKYYKSTTIFLKNSFMKKVYLIVLVIVLLSISIKSTDILKNTTFFNSEIQPQTPDKIFEKYKSSVVLIASQYYYEVYLDNAIYYYSPGSEKKFYLTKEAIFDNLSFSTGTGFIISEKGEIVTNNHVVNHKDDNFKNELANVYENVKIKLFQNIIKYKDTIEELESTFKQFSDQMTSNEKEKFEMRYDAVRNKTNGLITLYHKIDGVNFNRARAKLIIHKLGIAFNDEHITELDDLQECIIVKLSEKENVDLALIQTKNKIFNTKPKNIFNFADNNPNIIENPAKNKPRDIKKPVKINDDVFMIGFNKGFSLANTKQGIKSQFTSGKISQEYDGEKILYTIPTLEGSSGSPVVDKWGNLVGVNFAKISNSQSFSFAVPVYELKKFYEE